jgi:hypothetical protein
MEPNPPTSANKGKIICQRIYLELFVFLLLLSLATTRKSRLKPLRHLQLQQSWLLAHHQVAEPRQRVWSRAVLVVPLLQPAGLKEQADLLQQQVARQAQVVPAAACDTRLNYV